MPLRACRAAPLPCLLVLLACTRRESAAPPAGPAATAEVAAAPAAAAFDTTLSLEGVTFRVTSPNQGSVNVVTIATTGLELDNAERKREVNGTVVGAEVADLDVDRSPEVYVYVRSAGSGSYGSLVAYAANRKKSLSEISLPPVADNKDASPGYMGHDEFAVVENTFVQRFPVYKDGDSNANPTGGTRQLQYNLVPGEAGWVLKLDKVVSY